MISIAFKSCLQILAKERIWDLTNMTRYLDSIFVWVIVQSFSDANVNSSKLVLVYEAAGESYSLKGEEEGAISLISLETKSEEPKRDSAETIAP